MLDPRIDNVLAAIAAALRVSGAQASVAVLWLRYFFVISLGNGNVFLSPQGSFTSVPLKYTIAGINKRNHQLSLSFRSGQRRS
jgi:hypothetical protein